MLFGVGESRASRTKLRESSDSTKQFMPRLGAPNRYVELIYAFNMRNVKAHQGAFRERWRRVSAECASKEAVGVAKT